MQYISKSNMNKLLAYGGKDGVYYTMLNDNMYVVAKVVDEITVASKQFGSMKDAEIWLSKLK